MEPDTIRCYREPILLEWIETGEDLFRLVRNVLIHEIGAPFRPFGRRHRPAGEATA